MLTEYPLNVTAEIAYARKWAYSRNPAYFSFNGIGGDCTNFVSQCLYAGGAAMNYTTDTGWYYVSPQDRAAAWTSVRHLHRFLINNQGVGPFGEELPLNRVRTGDIIQLGNDTGFYHTLLIVGLWDGMPYLAAHSNDAFQVPLSHYQYEKLRCIHVAGARKWT